MVLYLKIALIQKIADQVVRLLNAQLTNIMSTIESEKKVDYFMSGREVKGFNSTDLGLKNGQKMPRFQNLTNTIRGVIAAQLISSLTEGNLELEKQFEEKLAKANTEISDRVAKILQHDEALLDEYNQQACDAKSVYDSRHNFGGKNSTNPYGGSHAADPYARQLIDKIASYDMETNVCTIKTTQFNCTNYISPWCKSFDAGTVLDTNTIQMAK